MFETKSLSWTIRGWGCHNSVQTSTQHLTPNRHTAPNKLPHQSPSHSVDHRLSQQQLRKSSLHDIIFTSESSPQGCSYSSPFHPLQRWLQIFPSKLPLGEGCWWHSAPFSAAQTRDVPEHDQKLGSITGVSKIFRNLCNNMECLQGGNFAQWEGKMCLQHEEHDSPPARQAPSTILWVNCGKSGRGTQPNDA